MQETFCVHLDYMSTQEDINEKMRAILIDRLIEVERLVNPAKKQAARI
jgi:hypothetical protein